MCKRHRIIAEYHGIDALIVPDCLLTKDGRVAWFPLSVVDMQCNIIAPSGEAKLRRDYRENNVDYSALKFKMLDSLGIVVKILEHDISQH